jgi:hypothetical protein
LTNTRVGHCDFQASELTALAANQGQSSAIIDPAEFVEYAGKEGETNTQKNLSHNTSSESVTAMLPALGPISNARLSEVLGTRPVEMPTGTFTVLDARVDDGNVVLDLQPKDQPGQTIRLNLPAQNFQELFGLSNANERGVLMPGMGGTQRVNIEPGTLAEAKRIEELALKLNLKEIEISDVSKAVKSPTTEDTSAKVVTVKIVAENAGQELVIKANLLRNELKATTPNRFVPDTPTVDASLNNQQVATKQGMAGTVVKDAIQNNPPANGFAAEQF